jgi:hypothetical protein
MEFIATARGSRAGGTSKGAIDPTEGPINTRASPCSAPNPNSSGRLSAWRPVAAQSEPATTRSTAIAISPTLRLSNRSAITPATGESRNIGTNWQKPMMPSWNEALAMDM